MKMSALKGFLAVVLFALTCASTPTTTFTSNITRKANFLENRSIANGVALRILPLGDSITWGYLSSDGNGYRLDLQNMLSGNAVQYVGSQQSGNMIDNYNEGHPGAIITQIASYAKASLPDRPNVVLLMAGTNDVNIPSDPADAPVHLASLIDEIITTCPDAAILVAQLTPIAGAASEALAQTFNAAVPGIVASRVSAGHSVLVVDMTNYVTVNDLADGLHPNDVGYNLMAQAWYAGIQKAAANGWINAPVASGIFLEIGGSCTTKLYWDPFYGQIASGVGHGDAAFVSGWLPGGTVAGGYVGTGNNQGAGVRLADLNGDGKDDYAWVDPVTGAITLDLNGGYTAGSGVNWIYKGVIASGIGDGAGVLFADINGDGLDDYLWVAPNGDVTAYKNGGENTSGGWLWYPLGVIVTGLGGTRATTRFADIDGDGRAEYLIVGPTGSLTAWFNSGFTDTPAWKFMGEIAAGVGDAAGVYLEDLNNDGRADYIWLDSVGAATVYINYRGAGAGLAPEWVPAGVVATGVGTSRDNITFGDMNGDGKKDYVFIHVDSGKLDVWFNTGAGGTYVTGDGIRFADMNGDGRDDYLFMDTNGAITLYINNGYSSSAGEWIWVPQGVVASGIAARKDIRMADLDGDGLADYLIVDEKSGAVHFWRNGGPNSAAPGGWNWYDLGQVASGIGEGAGVQFADINGDKKADYLWIDKNGAVTAYLNGGNAASGWIWYPQGVIATGVGAARADVQFHDLNGDGKADYLWVDRTVGSVQVWQNGGSGSNGWIWNPQGEVASGVGANGLCIQFADTTGDGRTDYLNVAPASGAVSEWFNSCASGASGGLTNHNVNPNAPPGWQTVACNYGSLTSIYNDGTQQWTDAEAVGAWNDAIYSWKNSAPAGASFVQYIGDFFKSKPDLGCDVIDNPNCDVTINCGQSSAPNAAVNSPAGYLIINGWVGIHTGFDNFYHALQYAESDMQTRIGDFSSTFSPVFNQDQALKLALDILGLGFAMFAAPTWNSWLKSASVFKGNSLGVTKDTVNSLVSNSITIAKDSSNVGLTTLAQMNKMDKFLGATVNAWIQMLSTQLKSLFDGSDSSVALLYTLISDSKTFNTRNTTGVVELQPIVEKALWGYMIPVAWKASTQNVLAFIATSEGVPQAPGKAGCDGWNPSKTSNLENLSGPNGVQNFVCGPGTGLAPYWITNIIDSRIIGCNPVRGFCGTITLGTLPGISKLGGSGRVGDWGGLSRDDLVISAVNAWIKNGKKNGWAQADPTNAATLADIYDNGLAASGLVNIPVCSFTEALANVAKKAPTPNYPCN